MADNIAAVITGDRQLAVKLDEFPKSLHDPLRQMIARAIASLAGRVRATMPVKTGRALGEVESSVADKGQKIVGYVGVSGDFAKIGALEYGAHRATKVAAHSALLGHVWRNRLEAPLKVMVAAYTRRPNIEAYKMFRGASEGLREQITAEIEHVVNNAAAGANAE